MNQQDEETWREIVKWWQFFDSDAESERCVQIRIANAPEFPGGSLPIDGVNSPVVDWWPVEQIEPRRQHLRKHGPFVNWQTKSGAAATADTLCRARGEGRIAAWIEGAIWEADKQWPDTWAPRGNMGPVWLAVRRTAIQKLNALQLGRRHHACSTAFPPCRSNLQWRVEEWLGPDFTSLEHDENDLLERIVGYAALRRALVLAEWALVDVAAVRGELKALPAIAGSPE